MKILLVSANQERNPYPVFPLGLSYLAGPLSAQGHVLQVLDLCFCDDTETAVNQALRNFRPDISVISIRNIDNVTFPGKRSYLSGVKKVVNSCSGKTITVLGGSGFSLMPVQLLAHLEGDYGVVGEGEEVLPQLVSALAEGISPASLPGVVVKGSTEYQAPVFNEKIGPAQRNLFHVDRYHREGGMANLQTKRGCPFSCIYCIYPHLEGRRIRLRPIMEVIDEIRDLVENFAVRYIYFVDDIFNYPPAYAESLCRAISSANLNINWSAFINPAFVTLSLLKAMLAAGCDAIEFGSESGSPPILKNLGKSFGIEQLRSASRLCLNEGVDFAHYLLFGGPGESEETIDETFALMDELEPTAVIAMTGIRIFPGTALHDKAVKDGIINLQTELLEPTFYISPPIRETMCSMVAERALARKNWVVPGLDINMSDNMLEAIRAYPVRGPLWKQLKRLGRSRVRPM